MGVDSSADSESDELQPGDCIQVDVAAGETLFLPPGWPHAVWTMEVR